MAESRATSVTELATEDAIKGTTFSKSRVISLLLRLLESVKKDVRNYSTQRKDSESSSSCTEFCFDTRPPDRDQTSDYGDQLKRASHVVKPDLDECLEHDLCKLWDASVNLHVSLFLHDHNAVELLIGSIRRSKSSRLIEVCSGIIGNMVCDQKICHEAMSSPVAQNLFISLLSDRDPGVLLESIRLIMTSLSHIEEQEAWLTTLKASATFFEDIIFILGNSTNEELLRILSKLLDQLLDLEDSLCSMWSCQSFLSAVCEASEQCRLTAIDVSCTLILILQFLSTASSGIEEIVKAHCVLHHLPCFLHSLSMQYGSINVHNSKQGLAAALSLCECILDNTNDTFFFKNISEDVTHFIQKLSSLSDDEECWNTDTNKQSKWENEDKNCIDSLIMEDAKKIMSRILDNRKSCN